MSIVSLSRKIIGVCFRDDVFLGTTKQTDFRYEGLKTANFIKFSQNASKTLSQLKCQSVMTKIKNPCINLSFIYFFPNKLPPINTVNVRFWR